ncbi:MAG: hypothetical protein O2875_00150 [Planctomycetota bacterium]|nr:hypothetical protein [Planctomycetota bacterium]
MLNFLFLIITLVSMTAIGLRVWKLVNRQERRDPNFQAKLDADDVRARKGRENRGG